MKKIFIALTLVLLLALVVATTVTARGGSVYGGAIANTRIKGKVFNLPSLMPGASTHVFLDLGGACSDLQATRNGNLISLTGVTHVSFDWPTHGAALVSGLVVVDMYIDAVNPQADGCVGPWVDEVYFDGMSLARKVVGGGVTSYCSGVPVGGGSWSSYIYAGYCP